MVTRVEGGSSPPDQASRRHVLQDLGWSVTRTASGEMRGEALLTPEMHVPGTGHLRTSILAAWADVIAGYLAVDTIGPRVPVTLELDVHLYEPPPGAGLLTGLARIVKSGRSVFVAGVDFSTEADGPIGFATASFMPAPDATLTITIPTGADQGFLAGGTRLSVPYAERAGCARTAPGEATISHSDETLNASNTLNGGLIALAVEEASLSLSPGSVLVSLDLRYLQPVRVGPAVADADVRDGLGRVEVRDTGNDDRLCVVATTRAAEAS
jgi:acyl-coenzyme A thioesterase PaaI-like protein